MEEYYISLFKTKKNRTIALEELESHVSGDMDYKSFAETILALENKGVLTRVKKHGDNGKNPSLAYTYRINKSVLKQDLQQQIKTARLHLHPSIILEDYFHLPEEKWENDYLFIQKVNEYILQHGFPTDPVPAPERSFELVDDEKWITEGGGHEILQRIQVWDKLLILPVSDPLMFAVNSECMQQNIHFHLIVENKTTYQGLLPALQSSGFTTLIYGSGKKIVKSIEHFDYQLLMPSKRNQFYYFGDLDYEGIFIWYLLSKKINVFPALPFYVECLRRPYAFGKENQSTHDEALTAFLPYFQQEEQEQIQKMLQNGGYYPQEIIKTHELQHIWRNTSWI